MRVVWADFDAAIERHPGLFWWRDDDAVAPSAALDRLIALTEDVGAPLMLATIPASTTEALARRLDAAPDVSVAVHGFAHRNHAPAGEKTAEFGAHRPLAEMRGEAASGLKRVRSVFGERALPVFVPPWNRISEEMPEHLAGLGFRAESRFASRASSDGPLLRFDAHLDPIDWRGTRSAVDPQDFVDRVTDLLKDAQPIGLMTHHLVHDGPVWELTEAVVRRIAHRSGQWASLDELMQEHDTGSGQATQLRSSR